MKTKTFSLDDIQIASPCPADWEAMQGDDQVRFCSECRLNVYNISAMSRNQAEQLIKEGEGRLCVRLFRREDGTVLTRDCPVGLRALRFRLARAVAGAAALVAAIMCGSLFARGGNQVSRQWRSDSPVARFIQWIEPPGAFPLGGAMAGDICLSPPPTPAPPAPTNISPP